MGSFGARIILSKINWGSIKKKIENATITNMLRIKCQRKSSRCSKKFISFLFLRCMLISWNKIVRFHFKNMRLPWVILLSLLQYDLLRFYQLVIFIGKSYKINSFCIIVQVNSNVILHFAFCYLLTGKGYYKKIISDIIQRWYCNWFKCGGSEKLEMNIALETTCYMLFD